MNIATLHLPSWITEVQQYGIKLYQKATTIVRAFNQTITPEIVATAKGVAVYYVECGHNAGCLAMQAAGITHNPLRAAVRSAYAELTSADAHATYKRISHIAKARAMDAIVIGLCSAVAVSEGIELAQKGYCKARAVYERFAPRRGAAVVLPEVDAETIKALVEDIQAERKFFERLDELDSSRLERVAVKVSEAAVQVTIANLKSARAALNLQVECDRSAQESLAYVIDSAIKFATDPWAELLPSMHTPPVVTNEIWNPPTQDIHVEVARLQQLQHVPLILPPGAELIAPRKATKNNAQRNAAPQEPAAQPKYKGRGASKPVPEAKAKRSTSKTK
jgi:hypothetical protein